MTTKTNSGKKKRQSKAATEQFNATFKKKIEQFMADKDSPEKFPTTEQLAIGIDLMPKGLPDDKKPYFITKLRNIMKWAMKKDNRFAVWSDYVKAADVKGWRMINAESDPVYMARLVSKKQIAAQTAEMWLTVAKDHANQYALDHPDKAEVLENLIDEMMQTKIKARA